MKPIRKNNGRLLQCYMCHIFIKKSISNLRRHMRLHGPKVNCIKCLACGLKLQNKGNLIIHWSRKHKDMGDEPKMRNSKRFAKGLRSVYLTENHQARNSTMKCVQYCSMEDNIQRPVFGVAPTFNNRIKNTHMKTTYSLFGLGLSSTLPTFASILNDIGSRVENSGQVFKLRCNIENGNETFAEKNRQVDDKKGIIIGKHEAKDINIKLNFDIPDFGLMDYQ